MKSKNFLFGISAIMLIFTMIAVGCDNGSGGGGDGGGGNNNNGGNNVIIDDWSWEAYSDRGDSVEGGTSTSTITQGSGNDSKKITFSGNVQNVSGQAWGYTGMHVTPNSANLTALKNADSFSFKCKGDGKQYNVGIRTTDVTDNDWYQTTFTASTTESTITIQYSDLKQNWGSIVTFNKSNIKILLFEATIPVTVEGPFNITIWDLKAGDQGGNGGGGEVTNGIFTLTGIPSQYNGKYAILSGAIATGSLGGAQSINITTDTITLVPISNGSVSLPMWKDVNTNNIVSYSGNDTAASVNVVISNLATSSLEFGDSFYSSMVVNITFNSVTFSNGGATRTWSQGQVSTQF